MALWLSILMCRAEVLLPHLASSTHLQFSAILSGLDVDGSYLAYFDSAHPGWKKGE